MSAPASHSTATTAAYLGLVVLLAALWGSSYAFVKIALGSVTPLTLTAARVTLGALVLAGFVWMRGHRLPRDGSTWRKLVVQSLVNIAVPFALFAWAQQFVPSALAGIINGSTPIFVFLITVLWTRHEPADRERLFGTVVGLAGVVTVIGIDALMGMGEHVIGEGAMLIGAVCYATAAILGRRFRGAPADVTAAASLGLAALVLIPLAFLVERPLALAPTPAAVWSILYLGIGCTAATFALYFFLVGRIGSMNTVSASYLRAGFAVLFGMALLGERFTWSIGIGLVAVMIGVAAINGQISRGLRWLRSVRVRHLT